MVQKADNLRLKSIVAVEVHDGKNSTEAKAVATLTYAARVGMQQLFPNMPKKEKLRLEQLFSSKIDSIQLRNRIIHSATHEGLADERGYPTDLLLKKYEMLAKNDVGCIITGFAGVMQNGKSNTHNMLMIDNDPFIDSYKQVTQRIHKY